MIHGRIERSAVVVRLALAWLVLASALPSSFKPSAQEQISTYVLHQTDTLRRQPHAVEAGGRDLVAAPKWSTATSVSPVPSTTIAGFKSAKSFEKLPLWPMVVYTCVPLALHHSPRDS